MVSKLINDSESDVEKMRRGGVWVGWSFSFDFLVFFPELTPIFRLVVRFLPTRSRFPFSLSLSLSFSLSHYRSF